MRNLAKIVIIILTGISIYVILYVGLGIGWSIGTSENYERINKVLENLSYSYLAGCIFYLLTTFYGHWIRKKQLRPVMRNKMYKNVSLIDSVISQFSIGVSTNTKPEKHDLELILNSKSWTDIIPTLKQYHGYDITYIGYCSFIGRNVRTNVIELIQLYKEYMSESQIKNLEAFIDMPIFLFVNHLSTIKNLNLDDPNGKKSLVKDFISMYEKLNSIYATF